MAGSRRRPEREAGRPGAARGAPAGGPPSKEDMAEHNRRLRAAMKKMRRVERIVAGFVDGADGLEGVDPAEVSAAVARRMLLARAIEATAGVAGEGMQDMGAEKLARVISGLDASRIAGERLRLQFEKGFHAARESLLRGIEEVLRDHPDLLARLREAAFPAGASSAAAAAARHPAHAPEEEREGGPGEDNERPEPLVEE